MGLPEFEFVIADEFRPCRLDADSVGTALEMTGPSRANFIGWRRSLQANDNRVCKKDQFPSVTAIILAAGESRRMGAQKVLLPFGGVTVLEQIVEVLHRGGADEIVVVTGHLSDRVGAVLQNTAARPVVNPDYLTGMLSSVRCGMRASAPDTQAWLIALGDQPSIRPEVVAAVIAEFRRSGNERGVIVVPTFAGKRGHPLLFSQHFRDDVLLRLDAAGLRGLLSAHPDQVIELAVNACEILRDMDYPSDYQFELAARRTAADAPRS